ncbi:Uncharacterised protein [Mycobacterium tuberculosis]|nr:Uncharacterised protein [Mycobacterium tuberculosis]
MVISSSSLNSPDPACSEWSSRNSRSSSERSTMLRTNRPLPAMSRLRREIPLVSGVDSAANLANNASKSCSADCSKTLSRCSAILCAISTSSWDV